MMATRREVLEVLGQVFSRDAVIRGAIGQNQDRLDRYNKIYMHLHKVYSDLYAQNDFDREIPELDSLLAVIRPVVQGVQDYFEKPDSTVAQGNALKQAFKALKDKDTRPRSEQIATSNAIFILQETQTLLAPHMHEEGILRLSGNPTEIAPKIASYNPSKLLTQDNKGPVYWDRKKERFDPDNVGAIMKRLFSFENSILGLDRKTDLTAEFFQQATNDAKLAYLIKKLPASHLRMLQIVIQMMQLGVQLQQSAVDQKKLPAAKQLKSHTFAAAAPGVFSTITWVGEPGLLAEFITYMIDKKDLVQELENAIKQKVAEGDLSATVYTSEAQLNPAAPGEVVTPVTPTSAAPGEESAPVTPTLTNTTTTTGEASRRFSFGSVTRAAADAGKIVSGAVSSAASTLSTLGASTATFHTDAASSSLSTRLRSASTSSTTHPTAQSFVGSSHLVKVDKDLLGKYQAALNRLLKMIGDEIEGNVTQFASAPKGQFAVMWNTRKDDFEKLEKLNVELTKLVGRLSVGDALQQSAKATSILDKIAKLHTQMDELYTQIYDSNLATHKDRKDEIANYFKAKEVILPTPAARPAVPPQKK